MEIFQQDLPEVGGYRDRLCRDLAPAQLPRQNLWSPPKSDAESVDRDCRSVMTDTQTDDDNDALVDDIDDDGDDGDLHEVHGYRAAETESTIEQGWDAHSATKFRRDLDLVLDCTADLDERLGRTEESLKSQRPWNTTTQQYLSSAQDDIRNMRSTLGKLEKRIDILWGERGNEDTDGNRKIARPKRKA